MDFADEDTHWMLYLMKSSMIDPNDMHSIESSLLDSFHYVSSAVLLSRKHRAHKHWISSTVLCLLNKRAAARLSSDSVFENSLSLHIKAQVKRDKSKWLNNKLGDKNWIG